MKAISSPSPVWFPLKWKRKEFISHMSHWTRNSGSWLKPYMKSVESADGHGVKDPF